MARYGKESTLRPAEILEKAVEFFGPGGSGLEVKDRNPCCVRFEGSGGHVVVEVSEKAHGSDVDLETREWDHHVKEFMSKL